MRVLGKKLKKKISSKIFYLIDCVWTIRLKYGTEKMIYKLSAHHLFAYYSSVSYLLRNRNSRVKSTRKYFI